MPNLSRRSRRRPRAAAYRDAHPRGAAAGIALRAADDALPHRRHAARPRSRAREGVGLRPRGQVLPGRRDDQFGLRASPRSTRVYPALAAMEKHGVRAVACTAKSPIPTSTCSIASACSSNAMLARIVRDFPALRIVVEHITTREAAQFVARRAGASRRDDHAAAPAVFAQRAVRRRPAPAPLLPADPQARSASRRRWSPRRRRGNPKFFLGTDSAPHARHAKESACGCAGCYSAPLALELYAEAFEAAGALDRLEGFASFYGADFYGLPRNADTVTLERESWTVPAELSVRRRHGRAAARRRDAALARRRRAALSRVRNCAAAVLS